MSKTFSITLATVWLAFVVACSSGPSSMSPASAGTMPVVSTGTITGFGSIYVNGVHFQTSSATIRKNGVGVAQSQLAVGEIARVKGSMDAAGDTGDADSVDVDENVVGPIAAIDTMNNLLTVLGQMVKINTGTSFSSDIQPADITGLKLTDLIRVSGLIDSSGVISATRIERNGSGEPLQVLGTVSSLDSTAHTFKINALLVNYSSANITGFSSGAPSNGDLIEAQGTMFDSATTTLTATRVARVESDQEEAGDDRTMEREGLITRFASASDFDVAAKPVTTTSTTMYRNGTVSDLALNVKVEVEGTLNSANVLVASVVEFHHNGHIELESNATAVNAMAGTVTLVGVQVTVNSMTRLEDDSSAEVASFSLSNIMVGDTLKVHGYESPAGSGMLVATRLERKSPSSTVMVEGPFTAAMSPDFTVFGITIDASAATLMGTGDAPLSLADFLTQAVGQNVEISGALSGTVVKATKIRIERHSDDGGDD